MMFPGAIGSSRTRKLKIFICASLLVVFSIAALLFMLISIRMVNESTAGNKNKIAALQVVIAEARQKAEIKPEEMGMLADVASIGSDNNRIYSPLYYVAALEKEKPDIVRFEELSFDVKKSSFTAIVLSREYTAVTSYLERLEANGVFKFAHLNKKGQVDREGVRYQVEFGVKEADSI